MIMSKKVYLKNSGDLGGTTAIEWLHTLGISFGLVYWKQKYTSPHVGIFMGKYNLLLYWISYCLRSRYGGASRWDPRAGRKRLCFIVLIAVVAILTVFTLLSQVLSGPSDEDPAFDPLANPNIRVAAVHDSPLTLRFCGLPHVF
uniref:Uncharacterized protein n=1 Tax=Parascaris equorum TaxID=6256 RepID=A0A914R677_PAREQ